MIAPKDRPPRGSTVDASARLNLDAVRAITTGRHGWGALREEERTLREFMERCGLVVEYAEMLKMDFDELSLVHDSIIEHATSIENELELRSRVIGEDLAVARQVQQALLPTVGGKIAAELEIAVYHKQLAEVGGDYYDFFNLPEDRYAVGVYDISGHGVSSALIMAFLKAQFLHATTRLSTASEIVEWVNHSSYPFLRGVRRYATVNFVVFNDRFIRYVSGGGYGLLVRQGTPRTFNRIGNFIGLRVTPFREFELPFGEGDVLALYTDGVPEAQGASGESYSVQRVNDVIMRHRDEPVQTILERCVEDYTQFRVADADDMTLIILRRCVH